MRLRLTLLLTAFVFSRAIAQDFWVQTNGPAGGAVTSLAIDSTGAVLAGTLSGGVFRSSDLGETWEQINNGLADTNVRTIAVSPGGSFFAGLDHSGVFRSSDSGQTWVPAGLTNKHVKSLVIDSNGYVFAVAFDSLRGIFRSTDNGANWTQVYDLYFFNMSFNDITISMNGYVWAVASRGDPGPCPCGRGVKLSTDNGNNWTDAGLSSELYSIAISQTGTIYAGSIARIFRSTDDGNTWTLTDTLLGTYVKAISNNSDGQAFAAMYGGGVFWSTNSGDIWIALNSGLTDSDVSALTVDPAGYIFVGTHSGGVFRSLQSTTGIKEPSHGIPSSFSLKQNYPNPFNPETRIRYELPKEVKVLLKIYNILGQEVVTLVNDLQKAGGYEVELTGGKFATGVYFYRLQAGEFVETKKLVLVK